MVSGLAGPGITFPPSVTLALENFPGETAVRAEAALQTLLHDRLAADGEQGWSGSRLTGDGFPLEITFTTADNRLRYTIEPGSRYLTPHQRLAAAVRLINILSPEPLSKDVVQTFQAVQKEAPLLFGAWIGGRHGSGGDQYKLYAETPGTAGGEANLAKLLAGRLGNYPQPRVLDRPVSLRMLAYSPVSGQWELYYRVKSLAPHHLKGVLAPAGHAASEELLRFITEAYGYSPGERLPGESVGISYTWPAPPDALPTVTLFFFARVFWGADGRIRRQFSRCASALGWDTTRYMNITAPLKNRRDWKTFHGILGITLTPAGQLALSIGVRPPETGVDASAAW